LLGSIEFIVKVKDNSSLLIQCRLNSAALYFEQDSAAQPAVFQKQLSGKCPFIPHNATGKTRLLKKIGNDSSVLRFDEYFYWQTAYCISH